MTVDQNDLTQHIFRRAQEEGQAPQQVIAHMQEHPHHLDEYMLEIRRGKALAAIVEAATVTDTNGDVVELSRIQPDGSLADPAAETEDAGDTDEPTDVVVEPVESTEDDAPEPTADRCGRGDRSQGLSRPDIALGQTFAAGLWQILR